MEEVSLAPARTHKAMDIDAGTAAGARQARRYSLFCLSLQYAHEQPGNAALPLDPDPRREDKSARERCFLSVIQNQEPRVRSLQEEA